MSERRVRQVGRPVYGRPQPLARPGAARGWRRGPRWHVGLLPRRLLLLVAVVVAGLWLAKAAFVISQVEVKVPARADEIKAEVVKLLAEDWRQTSLLTFDSSTLEARLMDVDPMVKSAVARRRWPHSISVAVVLKQPSLGWSSGNQQYLLDRDGGVIGALPAGTPVPVVVDDNNLPVKLGQQVATARFVTFTTGTAQALTGLGLNPTRYEVRDTTLDLYVTTAKGYRLILDTSRSVDEEVADLKTLVAFLTKQGKTPAEYIDLRIAGKVYYK